MTTAAPDLLRELALEVEALANARAQAAKAETAIATIRERLLAEAPDLFVAPAAAEPQRAARKPEAKPAGAGPRPHGTGRRKPEPGSLTPTGYARARGISDSHIYHLIKDGTLHGEALTPTGNIVPHHADEQIAAAQPEHSKLGAAVRKALAGVAVTAPGVTAAASEQQEGAPAHGSAEPSKPAETLARERREERRVSIDLLRRRDHVVLPDRDGYRVNGKRMGEGEVLDMAARILARREVAA